jgi:predicted nucleotidyltransferase
MFDISSLALKDSFTMQFRHPVTGELLWGDEEKTKPVEVVLYGTASKQYRNALNAMQARQLKRQAKKEKQTPEILKEESVSLLVACIAKFNEFALDGVVPSNDADYRSLLSDPAFSWVKEQIDEGLGDVSNFLAQ